jgi:virginiamycin B lyase
MLQARGVDATTCSPADGNPRLDVHGAFCQAAVVASTRLTGDEEETPRQRPRVLAGAGRRTTLLAAIAALICAVLVLWGAAFASQASAYIYWANVERNTIGRANLNGTGVEQGFITGASSPWGVAVDGAHVYWANYETGTIGRANLDGTGVEQGFITGASNPTGVAADGGHVYWTNRETRAIGRANLNGTEVEQEFITGVDFPWGVAADGGHVYWANLVDNTIGRANLDGTGVEQAFITGASDPTGVAVDGAHVYWANLVNKTIGRANLDGTGVEQGFITGVDFPFGVAVDGRYVYWTNLANNTIERASLDGTAVEQGFITGASEPAGVAVTPPPHVAGIEPAAGAAGGGNSVTIRGSGFHEGDTVTIGSQATSVKVMSEGEITATTSATTGGEEEVIVTDQTDGVSTGGPKYTYEAPPKASIASPGGAGGYALGAVVHSAYSCVEGEYGPGIESCEDSTGSSGPQGTLDTSTPGSRTYTVAAISKDGQRGEARIAYTVLAPPTALTTTVTPKVCVSQRKLTIHVRRHLDVPARTKIKSAKVLLAGRAVASLNGPHLIAQLSFAGLMRGAFKVTIVARTSTGRTRTMSMTIHTCISGKSQ